VEESILLLGNNFKPVLNLKAHGQRYNWSFEGVLFLE
jgi:hypothetical protein